MKKGKMSLLLVLCLFVLTGSAFAQTDLGVTNVTVKEKGNGVEIAATIKNESNQDANSYSVKFFADNQLIDTKNAGKLKKNKSKKVTANWNTSNLASGDYSIKVEVVNVSPTDGNNSNNTYNTTYHLEGNSPDLKINNISFKTKGNKNNLVEITTDVKNIGSGDATSYTVKFYANGQLIKSADEGQLKSDRNSKVTTEWDTSNLPGGSYTIKAEVTNVSPEEEDTNNNSYSTSYSVEEKKPDLTITNLSFKTKGNNPNEIEVTADIKNDGNEDAQSYVVKFYADGDLFSTENSAQLKKNKTKKVTTTWDVSELEGGNYTIKAEVAEVSPEEENTSNNSYLSDYSIESKEPDLTITDLTFKTKGNKTDEVEVTAEVKNIGEWDGDSFTVEFYANDKLFNSEDFGKIKKSQTKKAGTDWDISELEPGEYKVTAKVINVKPKESEVSNNSFTANYEIPCPDLYVYDVKFSPGEGIAKIDHHTNISVKIKNSGEIKANSCKVGVYYDLTPENEGDDPNLSEHIGGELIEVSGINPNDNSVSPVHIQWKPDGLLPDVVYPVYVIISEGDPEECDTTNNMYVTSYYFQESSSDSTDEENNFSLISPGMNAVLIDTSVTFMWEALICDSSKKDTMDVFYTFYIDTDSLFSNPVVVENISETFYTYGPFKDKTTYYWKVGATNCRGKWLWSNEVNWYFTIDFSYGFSLLSPIKDDTVKTELPDFTWEALANEDTGIVVYYDFYLDADSSFTNPLIVDSLLITEYTLTGSLSNDSLYFWKVKAFNNLGAEIWSREQDWFFYVLTNTNNNPAPFSLLTPVFDDTVLTLLPEFTWEQAVDADSSDSVRYLLYLSTDNSFANPVVSDTLSDTTYVPVVALNDNVTYFWKVKAIDKNGGKTWSDQINWYFYTLETSYAVLETPDVSTAPGEVLLVPVLLDNITNGELPVYSFQIQLQFDPTKLVFMDVLLTERTGELPIMYSLNAQTISITMFNFPGIFLAPGTGAIFNLQFLAAESGNVIDTTGVNYVITKLLDGQMKKISLELKCGTIFIQKDVLLGDLNNDGKLDLSDIEILVDIVMGTIQPDNYQQVVGDVNSDGTIDLLDVQLLIKTVKPPMVALQKILGDYKIQDYPTKYELTQSYPNPFNSTTMIRFSIPEMTHVNLSIININGQLVKTLVNRNLPMGFHNVLWDGSTNSGNLVSSGSYYYVMKTGKYTSIKSITLLK